MAHPKRKRKPTRTTSNKRPKYTQPDTDSCSSSSSSSQNSSSDKEEFVNESQIEWEAVRILAQRGQGFGLEYHIEWKGIDPATGQQWVPTWEKARNASGSLRESWKEEQAREREEKKKAPVEAESSTQYDEPSQVPPAQAVQTRARRHRRIVESPQTSTSAPATELPIEIGQSTTTEDLDTPLFESTSPQINADVRGESFNRAEYRSHIEIPESQSSPTRSNDEDTDLDSSQSFVSQRPFRASGIVPDTQSSFGDVSYVPVTQEELESSIHSDSTEEFTEDRVVGYSGLFSANATSRPDARAQSPATSIAETVAGTAQDSESQHHLEIQQEQPHIPETLPSSVDSSRSGPTAFHDHSTNSRHTNSTSKNSHCPQGQYVEGASEEVAFVEDTTHLDYESSSSYLQPSTQKHDNHIASAEGHPGSVQPDTQPLASPEEPELLSIADTPQISQLESTAPEVAVHRELSNSAHQPETTQLSAEVETEVSLTECSVLEENAQFAFHSQYPAFFETQFATTPTQHTLIELPTALSTHEVTGAQLSQDLSPGADQESGAVNESEESTTIDEISQPLEQGQSHTLPPRHSTPQLSQPQTNDRGRNTAIRDPESIIDQRSFAPVSQVSPCIEPSTYHPDLNAQLVSPCEFSSTHKEISGSILVTVEIHQAQESHLNPLDSPCSRHDSSQETPERQLQSVGHSSSPIPQPPSYSLRTLDSGVPPRPVTLTIGSSSSKMTESTGDDTGAKVAQELKELQAARRAANPYTPRRQRIRVSQPSSVASTGAFATGALLQPDRVSALPVIDVAAEGTRSPSTVPDRSPVPPVQTSLRNVAFTNANDKAAESMLKNPLAATSTNTEAGPTQEKADLVAAVTSGPAPIRPSASPRGSSNDINEEMTYASVSDGHDDDDDDEEQSFFDDELRLEDREYIVPLFIGGRQSDTYTEYIKRKTDLFDTVLYKDPEPEKLDEAEKVLAYVKAVETHPDLMYAEAESVTGFEMRSARDVEHGAQFGVDNSVKFKFLRELFNQLRGRDMHVVLLLEQDNNALSNILRTFFAAADHNYNMPTKGYSSNSSNDALTITVFSHAASPSIRPADLIICLDGVQSAAKIRQSNWAMASGRNVLVLHLVIPQTVGHIERYVAPNLDRKHRIETVLGALGQIQGRNEIGNAIDTDTPGVVEAARLIASWLYPDDDDQESLEWPLPSIGGAGSFMEFDQTQRSVLSEASSPVPERTKRPLDTDDSDTAKRMRYTPQPRVIPNSSAVHEHEATRVSDSMPGTAAAHDAHLAASLEKTKAELSRAMKEHREERVMWDKQQTEYETRRQAYRKLFNEKAEVDRAHESMTRNRDKLRTQLEIQATELKAVRDELEAQRNLSLESSNEKDVEITRLRKELEAAQLERNKALNSVKSTEQTLEYTKEQYRIASQRAGQLQTDVTALETQNAKLTHQASGEVAKLKQMHFDNSANNAMLQNKALKSEITHLKALLKQKEEELVRAKLNGGRPVYGTRGASTTPQPKTRSRAASPTGPRGPRGGRIPNLMAEER